MTFDNIFLFLPMMWGLVAASPTYVQTVTRLVVQNEVVWRVPIAPQPPVPRLEWVEHKGPACIPAHDIRRALISQSDQVDFVLADQRRVRAKFSDDCDALDFYGGFYLQPADDFLCAKRDAVHSRMGSNCSIRKFRTLEPRPKR
jgi:hypothetical protein